MLLPRQKDGFATSEKRTRNRSYFCRTYEEWEEKLDKLRKMKQEGAPGRIYSTYNPRSLKKGAIELMKLIMQAMVSDDWGFMCRGKGLIASCLKKKGTRHKRQYYMLDVDNVSEYGRAKEIIGDNYVCEQKTPNGFHILFTPMDIRLLSVLNDCEVKQDEFIFIEN